MNLYENIFIGRQDLSQQQMEALGVNLCLFVTQNGGEVVRGEYCGFRNLAYPIKKNHKGHYYVIQMKSDGSLVDKLNHVMRINEDIIRQMVVRVDNFDESENLISQAKTAGDDFGGMRDAGYRHYGNGSRSDVSDGEDLKSEIAVDVGIESKDILEKSNDQN